ncbi:hypothetical protein LTR94_033777, partial [Friedmanniomyces endolithicus]
RQRVQDQAGLALVLGEIDLQAGERAFHLRDAAGQPVQLSEKSVETTEGVGKARQGQTPSAAAIVSDRGSSRQPLPVQPTREKRGLVPVGTNRERLRFAEEAIRRPKS